MPAYNSGLGTFIREWMTLKNVVMQGDAGLQISVNSTNEVSRQKMFSGNALTLIRISEMLKDVEVRGRKITLNFALSEWEIKGDVLRNLFDPKKFLVKLTPMHKTSLAIEKGISTPGDYTTINPYLEVENNLKRYGFDVLVFVASKEEDEGRITCGNAILSGTEPFVS
jgi:23S rRNA (adenine2503-C2)-methyltransferase